MSIKSARARAKKTQAEVAALLGVSVASVSQWENGITLPNAARLLELANFLGVTVDFLLTPDHTPSDDD